MQIYVLSINGKQLDVDSDYQTILNKMITRVEDAPHFKPVVNQGIRRPRLEIVIELKEID